MVSLEGQCPQLFHSVCERSQPLWDFIGGTADYVTCSDAKQVEHKHQKIAKGTTDPRLEYLCESSCPKTVLKSSFLIQWQRSQYLPNVSKKHCVLQFLVQMKPFLVHFYIQLIHFVHLLFQIRGGLKMIIFSCPGQLNR